MRSTAPKQAETEFDDLLGQLVNELAMTAASESAVQLVPDAPTAEARVDSTHLMAAEAAAAAAAAAPRTQSAPANNNLVKIVAIITGSLTIVAVAALAVFVGGEQPSTGAEDPVAVAAAPDRVAELAAVEQAAVTRARADQIAAERAATTADAVRITAGLLSNDAKARAEAAAAASKPAPRKRGRKNKRKKVTKSGDSFDDM